MGVGLSLDGIPTFFVVSLHPFYRCFDNWLLLSLLFCFFLKYILLLSRGKTSGLTLFNKNNEFRPLPPFGGFCLDCDINRLVDPIYLFSGPGQVDGYFFIQIHGHPCYQTWWFDLLWYVDVLLPIFVGRRMASFVLRSLTENHLAWSSILSRTSTVALSSASGNICDFRPYRL